MKIFSSGGSLENIKSVIGNKKVLRILIKTLYPIVKFYWFVFRPKTYGVKCIVTNGKEMVLVRHAYGQGKWTFPGGRIERNELPESTAIREIKEELGIELASVKPIGKFLYTGEYKKDTIHCFVAESKTRDLDIEGLELLEARWFPAIKITVQISSVAQKILNMWQ